MPATPPPIQPGSPVAVPARPSPLAAPAAAVSGLAVSPTPAAVPGGPSLWDRISVWVSENKAVVYTIAGIAVVVTGAGVFYYLNSSSVSTACPPPLSTHGSNNSYRSLSTDPTQTLQALDPQSTPKSSKKERRKRKEAERKAAEADSASSSSKQEATPPPSVAAAAVEYDVLPEIDEAAVQAMDAEERKKTALTLKEAGNRAYGAKDFQKAIDLYSQAILCKQDPVYYSNRAACYSALQDWDKVVEDTTAAVSIDAEYVKALNRRANAYERLGRFSDSLLDYTASCIIDGFNNNASAQAVERLLKKFAEAEAKELMAKRQVVLPGATFVSNYLQSFRPKPRPAGLEDTAELPDGTGKALLRLGFQALDKQTPDGYEEASAAFENAIELGGLDEFEALAYNMRGTFECLKGKHENALSDLTKSIELDPTMTQSYIKRASMNLELGTSTLELSLFLSPY